jgi:hypothetical protein
MFPALTAEKTVFPPFVFKMFPALGNLSLVGRNVATEFGGIEAGKVTS